MTNKITSKKSIVCYLKVVQVLSFFDGERVSNGEHYAKHHQYQSVQSTQQLGQGRPAQHHKRTVTNLLIDETVHNKLTNNHSFSLHKHYELKMRSPFHQGQSSHTHAQRAHACTHKQTNKHTHANTHTHMHSSTLTHTHTHAHMHARTNIESCASVHKC